VYSYKYIEAYLYLLKELLWDTVNILNS